ASPPEVHSVQSAGGAVGQVTQQSPRPARNELARATRLLTDAERIAKSITDKYSKAKALREIAKALAATDPDRAERFAKSITDNYSKAEALREIAKALAATDPDRAARLFTDAERIAKSITDDKRLKAGALGNVATAAAST